LKPYSVFVAKFLVLVLLGSAIDLSDFDVFVGRKFGAQLVPSWCQTLAMAAPWSIELDKSDS
jgi:hypothetical protein